MSFSTKLISAAIGLSVIAGVAHGAAHTKELEAAVKARQSVMRLYAHNLGALGAMAKGEVEYDAEAAKTAAANLAAVNSLKMAVWLPGTDSDSMEGTNALPAIWENLDDFMAKGGALKAAVADLQGAAGTDLASLQAAVGKVGMACGSCHKSYQKSQ